MGNKVKKLFLKRMRVSRLIIFFCLYSVFNTVALGISTVDSLKFVLEQTSSDSARCMILRDISWETQFDNADSGIHYAKEAVFVAQKTGNDFCIGKTTSQLANALYFTGEYDLAIEQYIKAVKLAEKRKDTATLASLYSNIGAIFSKTSRHKQALSYFQEAYQLDSIRQDTVNMLSTLTNLGGALAELHLFEQAKKRLLMVLSLNPDNNLKGSILHNLAAISLQDSAKSSIIEAQEYLLEAEGILQKTNRKFQLANTYKLLGRSCVQLKKFHEGEEYYKKGLVLTKQLSDYSLFVRFYTLYSILCSNTNRMSEALQYEHLASLYKDSLYDQQTNRAITDVERKYQTDKIRQENKIKQLELENEKQITKEQQIYIYIALGGVLVLGMLAFLLLRGNRIKQRANESLRTANAQITSQKEIIEEKNKDITDSINYAQFIQSSILPEPTLLNNHFDDSFILYIPRDIVAGDFYWYHERDGYVYVSASDCTGHGVPGGFVSMLCSSALTQSIGEAHLPTPGKLLEMVNAGILRMLVQNGNQQDVKDGMDSSILRYKIGGDQVEYAGAQRPLVVVRKGEEPVRIVGDKMPVGGWTPTDYTFNTHIIDVQPGDHLYMFSDGYPDQFGGPKFKKFMASRLRKLMSEMVEKGLSMEDQRAKLAHTIMEWKGDHEQIDDILVMGIRI